MESQRFVNSSGGLKSTGFFPSQDISFSFEAKTSYGDNDGASKITQIGSCLYKDGTDILQVGGARNTTRNVEGLTREISTDAGRETTVPSKSLTAQALRELDLHLASYFESSGSMHDVYLGHHINHKGAMPWSRSREAYSKNSIALVNENQLEYRKESITYMRSDADVGSHNYQVTELRVTTSDQEHIIDMPEYDTNDTDPVWDLTPKGNDFAGIGGQFAAGTCEEYASADDFTVEEDFVDNAE